MADSPDSPAEWRYDSMPAVSGWFAVVCCYDPEEGCFPDTVYATEGKVKWPDTRRMAEDGSTGHAGPFATQEEADAWAYDHDLF